jgi:predicted transcriptional regulator
MSAQVEPEPAARIFRLLTGGAGALDLKATDTLVLISLLTYADSNGLSQPTYSQLEQGTGATRAAIVGALQRLLERGLLLLHTARYGRQPAKFVVGPAVWEV